MVRRTPHLRSIGAYDAKTRFSELLARVEDGQEVTITRHGRPVAKLVPLNPRATPAQARDAIERWLAGDRPRLRGLRVKDLIAEGRR